MNKEQQYWETIAGNWQEQHPQALWREHSDAVNLALLQNWWPDEQVDSVLKTDLFDEAFGAGLHPLIRSNARSIHGIDISATIVAEVGRKCPEIQATAADVRRLPFRNDKFDLIISNSTLDHFESADDIGVALAELYRVLRPNGQMILTLDNLRNPMIALRHILPFRLLKSLGIVPYFVGSTLGPRGLGKLARDTGFKVIDTASIMHCPRVIAVAVARLMQKHARHPAQQRFLRSMMAFEKLSRLPTHTITGHFVAIRAIK